MTTDELAEAERCGRYTGHGEACDYPRAEYADACGFHLAEDNRRLRAELERLKGELVQQVTWTAEKAFRRGDL